MTSLAYINGEFIRLDEAKVSIQDRGFQFGDSIYEVIRLYNGKLFKGEEHFKRLLKSANAIRLDLKKDIKELNDIAQQVINRNRIERFSSLYVQITRGVATRNHNFEFDLNPTIIMYLLSNKNKFEGIREKGVNVITLPDLRWAYCNIKTTNLLANILGSQLAKESGAYEGVFLSHDNIVREGTSSNVFIIKDKKIITHPEDRSILGGITRNIVLELANKDFEVEERCFFLEDMYVADEVFISSTTKEILGVVSVDCKKINQGNVGGITKELHKRYIEYNINWDKI